jgi:hypothetical protein
MADLRALCLKLGLGGRRPVSRAEISLLMRRAVRTACASFWNGNSTARFGFAMDVVVRTAAIGRPMWPLIRSWAIWAL